MGRIRVLVVDDHPMVCDGIVRNLSDFEDIEVVGQGVCAEDAVALCRDTNADVLVLDYSMPDLDGATTTRRLRENGHTIPIVILTRNEGVHYAINSLRAGAQGFVMKSRLTGVLVEAIRTVAAGAQFVSPPLDDEVRRILEQDSRRKGRTSLSAREMQVLRYLGEGYTLQQVATTLDVAESTASTYRARLMAKLNLTNTAQLIRFAVDMERAIDQAAAANEDDSDSVHESTPSAEHRAPAGNGRGPARAHDGDDDGVGDRDRDRDGDGRDGDVPRTRPNGRRRSHDADT